MNEYNELSKKLKQAEDEYKNSFSEQEYKTIQTILSTRKTDLTNNELELMKRSRKLRKTIKKIKIQIDKNFQHQKLKEDSYSKLKELKNKIKNKNLLSIDLEFHEKTKVITEVGVSIFKNGNFSHHHFIVEKYYNLRNGKYIPDNKDNFNYGNSIITDLNSIKEKTKKLLKDIDFIVGQDILNDVFFINQADFSFDVKTLDTQQYFKYVSFDKQKHSLKTIIKKLLKEEPKNLHNAGNDAYYTLQCLFALTCYNFEV